MLIVFKDTFQCSVASLLVRYILQVAKRSVEPDPVRVAAATPASVCGDQPRRPPASAGRRGTGSRAPHLWSQDEAMLRSGIFSGAYAGPWRHTALGGSQVARQLRRYIADLHNMGGGGSCNKWQRGTIQLIPGVMLLWCMCCGKCLLFAIMPDAESPRTIFDLLYTHLPEPPQVFMMDNGCNVHLFVKGREPQHFTGTRFLIDEMHFRDHTNCSQGYRSGALSVALLRAAAQPGFDILSQSCNIAPQIVRAYADICVPCPIAGIYPDITNSPLAEQKNAALRRLASQLAYMDQITLMRFLRFKLYRMNRQQELTNQGVSFV